MTFLAHHDALFAHDLPGHPERAVRARALLAQVASAPALRTLARLTPDRPATDDELLRVHAPEVLAALAEASAEAPTWLDPDTYVVAGSENAARWTARLGILAVQRALLHGERGFVIARPPGHHATRTRSMGFCLLNNVAIAAAHVLHLGLARRVLIFDHDVHHGNGTQDIFWSSNEVLVQSFHLAHHFPGTGLVDEIGAGPGLGYTMNAPMWSGDGDAEVRSLMDRVFLPVAERFAPELVLVSAGFDSLEGDPLGGMTLTPRFFGELIARFARVCPHVVAFLEGGYAIDAIGEPFEWELRALDGERIAAGFERRSPVCEDALRALLAPHWDIAERAQASGSQHAP